MNKVLVVRAIMAALLVMLPVVAVATPSNEMDQKLAALIAAENALPYGADPGPPLREVYASEFGAFKIDDLHGLSDYDLRLYLRASKTLAFYTFDRKYLERVGIAFSELESRGIVTQHDFSSLFDTYIQFRDLVGAGALAERHAEFEHQPLPRFTGFDREFSGPTVLVLEDDGSISRLPAGLAAEGPQVVVAGHPLCHFSENAIRFIDKDEQLAAMFAGRTLWLMPQDGDLNLDVVAEWNRQFPDYAMRWAYQTSDWPMIKRWATPNFYFYRDGKLVTTVIGWPPEGQRDALISAFKEIGVERGAPAQRSR